MCVCVCVYIYIYIYVCVCVCVCVCVYILCVSQLPSLDGARVSALEERVRLQAARIEEAEREKRKWQVAFRRLSTSLQSSHAPVAQAQGGAADTATDGAACRPLLDGIAEAGDEYGPSLEREARSGVQRGQSTSSDVDELNAVCEESDELEQQAAVIAQLVAHKHEAEREQRQLYARLSRLLTHEARATERGEASETAESMDADAAIDVSPAQLEASWSVPRALHSQLPPTPLEAALTRSPDRLLVVCAVAMSLRRCPASASCVRSWRVGCSGRGRRAVY